MPQFGRASSEHLLTCDRRLFVVCTDVIRHLDFAVFCGHRGQLPQDAAYAAGTSQLRYPHSPHNKMPSLAVDLAPWFDAAPHIRWDDHAAFHRLAGAMLYAAAIRGIQLEWGGDWPTFKDLPHFQVPPVANDRPEVTR